MIKQIEFTEPAAAVLVDTEGIDTMTKLAKITSPRVSKLAKAICSPVGRTREFM